MLPETNPTRTQSWELLAAHFAESKQQNILELFNTDTERAQKFAVQSEDVLVDFSKNHFTEETSKLFAQLFLECGLPQATRALFAGEAINQTENRAVAHFALRSPQKKLVNGKDVTQNVAAVLDQAKTFSEKVRSGKWLGYTGKPIKTIVNIGIGGSDLGPRMATEALKDYAASHLSFHFVANVDGAEIEHVLRQANAEETLFIISSKSFTTQETMTNAHTARNWFLKHASQADVGKHFVAVSTNKSAVTDFGINPENMFVFWNWVGGRYSVWSAIGLPVMLAIGAENFNQFLAGAHAADEHFKTQPFHKNIPQILAALGIWYRNFWNYNSYAILPYASNLKHFPAYMQQADMESNGKSTARDKTAVNYQTGPIVWGQPGTNGQHAFYQLLHQGTTVVPCHFVAVAQPNHKHTSHNNQLLANCFAQSEALLKGKSPSEVVAELRAQNKSEKEIDDVLPYKTFAGNRPSTTILLKELSPYNLGKLIAFYEHKIFVEGVIWNIYSFDQWGVELGKVLATNLLADIDKRTIAGSHDASTKQLMQQFLNWQKS